MMARRQAGSARTFVEDVGSHAVKKKDDGGLAAAPGRCQQRPDQAGHGARDGGEVGAVESA